MSRNISHITDQIKKNRKCFTKWSSLPVQYLLLVVDAWTVGGGGGGVLGDGGWELAAGSRPISWARGEMEGVRQKDGGEEVAWIRVKPETLSLALEKKSFLNCGLIWLRGRAPPPLQVKEADEFCVCWIALYSVALRPATLLRSRLCGTLCLCVRAARGDVFVHVKCLKSFLSTRDEKNSERCGPDGRSMSQPATVEGSKLHCRSRRLNSPR